VAVSWVGELVVLLAMGAATYPTSLFSFAELRCVVESSTDPALNYWWPIVESSD
jgi:hypothetical protein